MAMITNIILLVQVLSALAMIGLILIQHGKGADMGAAFGSGSSGSLFGATGGANFLSRSTAVLAGIFFVSTLALAYLGGAKKEAPSGSVLESVQLQGAPADKTASPASQIPGPNDQVKSNSGAQSDASVPSMPANNSSGSSSPLSSK
jgi:preprotein translocase subunit SecG